MELQLILLLMFRFVLPKLICPILIGRLFVPIAPARSPGLSGGRCGRVAGKPGRVVGSSGRAMFGLDGSSGVTGRTVSIPRKSPKSPGEGRPGTTAGNVDGRVDGSWLLPPSGNLFEGRFAPRFGRFGIFPGRPFGRLLPSGKLGLVEMPGLAGSAGRVAGGLGLEGFKPPVMFSGNRLGNCPGNLLVGRLPSGRFGRAPNCGNWELGRVDGRMLFGRLG